MSWRAGIVFSLGSILLGPVSLVSGAEVGYYSQPALYGDRLIFVSEGDLWTANIAPAAEGKSGEKPNDKDQPIVAHRLTSSDGDEARPCISPDGNWVAFTAQYDGNSDVFVMAVDGGPPRRLTFHPAPDIALGWTPDGQSVLFSSPRSQPLGRPELWRVPEGGGPAVRYEFGECTMISMSSTGKRCAFTRWSNENWTWKRYRGGTAPDVWVGELATSNFVNLTANRANDLFPMWLADRVYFLSDRTGTANIFSDSPDNPGKDLKQHTKFAADPSKPLMTEGYDVRWPSADARRRGTRIAFCQAGGLALLDTADDSVRRLDIRLASDRTEARQRFADADEALTEFSLSPDGKAIFVGTRGELMRLPVENGVPMQITHSSASREWGVSSLDDDRVLLITDATGEQQMAVAPADGSDKPSLLTEDRQDWLFPPVGSPDAQWVAFADKTLRLHVLNVKTLVKQQIDQSEAGEITDYRFSPDGNWLAYAKPMPNGMRSVNIYSVRTNRSVSVSSGMSDDHDPRWDPAGKYLYFLSERHINPTIGQMDLEYVLVNTTEAYAVPLAITTPPPFKQQAKAADFDLEAWGTPRPDDKDDDEDDDDAKGAAAAGDMPPAVAVPPANAGGKPGANPPAPADKDKKADDDAKPGKKSKKQAEAQWKPGAPMVVDADGIASRQFKIPLPPGNYSELEAIWGGVTYLAQPAPGLNDEPDFGPPTPDASLHRYSFVAEEDKTLGDKIAAYAVSRNAKALAIPTLGEEGKIAGFVVIDPVAAGGPPSDEDKSAKRVDVDSLQIRIEARQEWAQILAEAWRLQRDFFWAPNYVGVNWPAMRQKYEALLPRIGSRAELNDLIGQLIGELGNSHTYVWGGQRQRETKPIGVGMLGADIVFDGQGWKIARIVPGQAWGESKYVSPLEAPHLGVKPGAYVLAINGQRLEGPTDIYDFLQNQAGKNVRLTIANAPNGEGSRVIEVKTLPSEQPLRYAAWVEANRRYVEEKSQGRIGYMHVPDMGADGLTMFTRQFYPQFKKPAIVIDERDNGGGFVSQMLIERLSRKLLSYDQPRQGVIERYPYRAVDAHLAVLIDQHAGSDGDIFPQSFKMLGLGPLIGTRTWGGVVGIRGDKPFVDLGLSTQPEFAWWAPKEGWAVENEGVSPDIEVDITPADRVAGRDPQLDKAIEYLLGKLKEDPKEQPKPPPFPVRVK